MKTVVVFGLMGSVLMGSIGCWGRGDRGVDVHVEERRSPNHEERREDKHEEKHEEHHEEHH